MHLRFFSLVTPLMVHVEQLTEFALLYKFPCGKGVCNGARYICNVSLFAN